MKPILSPHRLRIRTIVTGLMTEPEFHVYLGPDKIGEIWRGSKGWRHTKMRVANAWGGFPSKRAAADDLAFCVEQEGK